MGKGDPGGGRPRIEIDMKLLEGMATIMCTAEECAAILGITVDTIDARLKEATGEGFSEFRKKHGDTGKRSLRRAQFDLAVKGHATMLIWLGKQWLGQEDKITHEIDIPDGRAMFEVIVPIMGKGKGNGHDPEGIEPAAPAPTGTPKIR